MKSPGGTTNEQDVELLRRLRAHDVSAIDLLLARHGARLILEAEKLGLDGEVHALRVVTYAWNNREAITSGVHAYIDRIHRSVLGKQRELLKRRTFVPIDNLGLELRAPEPDARIAEVLAVADRVLSDEERRVLELRHLEGATVPEAARALGISEPTVKRTTKRIIQKLQVAMGVLVGSDT